MPSVAQHCRWTVSRTNRAYVEYVSRLAGLSFHVSQVLINRGIKTAEQIDSFLNPCLAKLADPYTLQGMHESVGRI